MVGLDILDQVRLLQTLGHRDDRPALSHLGQDVRHLALQEQPRVKDDIGPQEHRHVAPRRAVHMRVDAGADDAGDLGPVARDLADDVCDHPHGGRRPIGVFSVIGRCRRENERGCEQKHAPECGRRSRS